ncbi:SH3 domain-containing protein [Flagellimonas sp. CMM7]|uniref:SH3 domain-containing protein n=1 Tax=Flagellimonas sp. CMM7 TaxID=2654676 RepID=UPI0013D43CEB|nr:SH3 domain-containing protein [Flagellimonas sp. CMM7]UII78383.1 SH3 domain-containing protein [Flagellimonas sp. CMM7]
MKAVFYITALTTLFTISLITAQNGYNCPLGECDFEPGEQVYLFGNDVKLRAAPDVESEVLELLKIGEWVKIIEKTEFSWPYRGFDSPFYKVQYHDDVTGYVLAGLLSFEKKVLNNQNYFFAYSKEGKSIFLNIRNIKNGTYIEKKIPLVNTNIDIKVMDDKGIPDLDGILFVDYYAEACGMEGGGIYLFVQNDELTKVAALSQISDAGVFYYSEKFIFPFDEGGIPEKIIFKKERNESLDEASRWTKTAMETRELSWVEGKLVPKYRE